MAKTYHKLVRDKIPEIIESDGKKCVTRALSQEEYLKELRRKLDEEVQEYHESGDHEELADILEVVYALATATGCTEDALNIIRQEKAQKRQQSKIICRSKALGLKTKGNQPDPRIKPNRLNGNTDHDHPNRKHGRHRPRQLPKNGPQQHTNA